MVYASLRTQLSLHEDSCARTDEAECLTQIYFPAKVGKHFLYFTFTTVHYILKLWCGEESRREETSTFRSSFITLLHWSNNDGCTKSQLFQGTLRSPLLCRDEIRRFYTRFPWKMREICDFWSLDTLICTVFCDEFIDFRVKNTLFTSGYWWNRWKGAVKRLKSGGGVNLHLTKFGLFFIENQ